MTTKFIVTTIIFAVTVVVGLQLWGVEVVCVAEVMTAQNNKNLKFIKNAIMSNVGSSIIIHNKCLM
jgi:hypothetical protein